MDDRSYCLYCHTSPNGKKYIGITCTKPSRRWNNGKGYRQNPYFWKAIQKYGWENIAHEILYENLSQNEAIRREIEEISNYKSNDSRYGYNLSIGGESGFHGCSWSEDRKEYMRQKRRGNKYSLGFKHSEETRKRMSDAQLRREYRPLTVEQKAKCIANLPAPRFGVENPASRAVLCVETGVVYSCGKEAAERMGLQRSHISNVCRGKRKTTGGYTFKYYENK